MIDRSKTSPDEPPRLQRRRPKTWKSLVLARADRLKDELDEALASSPPPPDLDRDTISRSVQRQIDEARAAVNRVKGPVRTLANWINGAEIERAWLALHAAGEQLISIQREDRVRAQIPDIENAMTARLPGHPLVRVLREQLGGPEFATRELRGREREFVRMMREALDRDSDDAYGRVRSFRNVLLLVGVLLSVALGFLALDAPGASFLPVCPTSSAQSSQCPEMWQILATGALGGALAMFFAVSKLEGFRGPYSLPMVQALIKAPVGALTGLLGALWVQNRLFSAVASQDAEKLLAYVALFGFAQQAFMAFADRQARNLLGEARGAAPSP